MKKIALSSLFIVVCCLLFTFAAIAHAAGSDAAGWSVSGAESALGPVDLGNGDVTSDRQWKPGIDVYSSGKAVKNGGSVTTNDYNTHAVIVSGVGSSLDLTNVSVKTYGEASYGLYSHNSSDITMTGGSVETLADNRHPQSNSPGAYAVYADRGSVITLNDVDVSSKNGLVSHAVIASSGGTVKLNGGTVRTEGESSFALTTSGDGSHIYANDVDITTEGHYAHAVDAHNTGGSFATNSYVSIENSRIITNGDDAIGIRIVNNNELYLKNTQITTNGQNSQGVVVTAAGARAYLEDADIKVNDPTGGAYAIALHIQQGGEVTLKNGSFHSPTGFHTAIRAVSSSTFGQTKVIGLDGVYDILGGIYASSYATVDITMADGSLFTGWTEYKSDDATSAINLSLNGANTTWKLNYDSWLTNLDMDGATVDFRPSSEFTTLTVEKLNSAGSGTGGSFIMRADIPGETSDQIIVTDRNSSGFYNIKVLNAGSAAASGDEIVTLATTAFGSNVTFGLANTVECGAWQYGMHYVQGFPAVPGVGGIDDEWQLRGTGRASTPGSGAINSFAGSYLMAYADTQTLIQRMGDLRESPYGQGLWFRLHGGKFESNSKSYVRGFDMDYGGVQIGYDRKIENKWDGELYVGAMFGYSKGDLDYHRDGSGEVDSKTLGIYGTYIGRSGFYIDTILKYQWMTNDFDVIDTAGTLVRGQEVDTGGIGASVEIGKRVHLGDGKENRNGWYVEPQVQLSYQRQDGGYFNATNGLRIGVDSFNSLLGRVGMLVGYETNRTNLYAKVSKVKEFDGDLTIRANGVPISESFEDDWWVYGIGCTSRINDRNSLYLDIERTSGGSFSQPWRIFAGWRVEF